MNAKNQPVYKEQIKAAATEQSLIEDDIEEGQMSPDINTSTTKLVSNLLV